MRLRRAAAALFLIVLLCALGIWTRPWFVHRAMLRDVVGLEAIIPVIERLKVTAFRNQDWCRNISYTHGKYSNNNTSSTCNLFDGRAVAFDPQANEDFSFLVNTLEDAQNARIVYINVDYDAKNRVEFMDVKLGRWCGFCDSWSYLYTRTPNHSYEDIPHEMEYTRLDDHWTFLEEDWN